jgi:hypothetical protein
MYNLAKQRLYGKCMGAAILLHRQYWIYTLYTCGLFKLASSTHDSSMPDFKHMHALVFLAVLMLLLAVTPYACCFC